MGAVPRPAAPRGADAGDRSQRRHRQSAGVRRRPAKCCPAAISTPSRWRSPPTSSALASAEIGTLSERRIAMLVDPTMSGLPAFLVAAAGSQLRLHDRAGDRRRAGRREQTARPSGLRRTRFRPPPTRKITSRWPPWRAPAARHGGERRERRRDRTARRRAGLRVPRADDVEPAARARAHAVCANACRRYDRDRYFAPDIAAAADLVRSGVLPRSPALNCRASTVRTHGPEPHAARGFRCPPVSTTRA